MSADPLQLARAAEVQCQDFTGLGTQAPVSQTSIYSLCDLDKLILLTSVSPFENWGSYYLILACKD